VNRLSYSLALAAIVAGVAFAFVAFLADPREGAATGRKADNPPVVRRSVPVSTSVQIVGRTRDKDRCVLRVRPVDDAGNALRTLAIRLEPTGAAQGAGYPDLACDESTRVPAGDWDLVVESRLLRRTIPLAIDVGTVTLAVVVMDRGRAIRGVVRHRTGGPLPGVTLTLQRKTRHGYDRLETRTDEEGTYRLEGVPPGVYDVAAHGPGIGAVPYGRFRLRVPSLGPAVQDFEFGSVSIRGCVREASTKVPLSDARLRVVGPLGGRTLTDANGAFEFNDLPNGDYRIVCERDGYEPRTVPLAIRRTSEALVADISLRRSAAVRITAVDTEGHAVQGRFYLRMDRVDAEGAQTARTIFTNHEGSSVLRGVGPGRYVASLARIPGGGSRTTEVDIKAGENEIRLQVPEGPAVQREGAALFGTVSDARTGRPIAGVRVWSSDNLLEQYTSRAGEYAVRGVPSARYSVIFEKPGYVSRRLSRPGGTSGGRGLNVSLERAASLVIRLRDASDKPVRERVCIIRDLGGQAVSELAQADDDGRIVYRRLGSGPCQLGIVASCGARAHFTVDILPNKENDVVVRLRR